MGKIPKPFAKVIPCAEFVLTCSFKMAAPSCFATWETIHCWKKYLNHVQCSKFTSAVGNYRGFCPGKQCFYSNHLGKNIARGNYFVAKYIFSLQFIILISRQNYRLQTRDITWTCYRSVCMCYKKSDQLYIFGSLFILFLFVHLAMEQALLSGLISSHWRSSVTSHF